MLVLAKILSNLQELYMYLITVSDVKISKLKKNMYRNGLLDKDK